MQADDLLGLLGSAMLLFAPARDQYGRLKVLASSWRARRSESFRDIWSDAATTHEASRNSFSFLDSLTMAAGAVCLGLSYWL